jgi:DNA repair exonuclease SbcCD nuclease subunit
MMPARLFHISDIHFGLEDTEVLDWVTECVRREAPDAVAITGDLTMRARRREFAAAARWIRALGVPVTVEVGNHDLPYFNLFERFTDPYRRFRALETAVERTVSLPGVAIVPLKTTARAQLRLNWSKGRVGLSSLTACLAAIDVLPKGTRALVACHHPLVETGTHGSALTRGGERALTALARRGVLGVLSGHVHDAFDIVHQTAEGPVRMIGAGTLSQRVRTTPAGFNELSFTEAGLVVAVRAMGSKPAPPRIHDAVPEDAEPPTDIVSLA